ncbi:hypothetical protein EDD86DRAFT_140287 [Gorgonomyces haynaldii]|nr:hypothetical protein EDD86DRAFT_140287 [Gorgonomyces haynaldii]
MEQKLEHRQPKEERVLNPKDELERLKLDHAKHMAYLQFEKERVLSQHELEQIKLEFEKKEEKEEKKHTVVSIDWTGLKTTQYNPTRGFAFVLQYLQGMTEFASHIQICYCLFEGQTSLQQAQHIGPLKVESSSRSFNCSIQSQQLVYGVHASQEVKLYIDIRSYPNGQQRHSAPIGWTIIEPFDNKNILQSGDWKTRLFSHPIIFDKPLQVLMKEKPLNGMHLYLTIVDTCHPHILGRRLDVFPDQFVFHAQMGPNQIEFTEPFKQEKSSKKTSSVKIKKKEIQEVKEEQELVDDLVIITGEPEQQQAVEEKQEEQVQLENVYPLGMQLNTIGNLFTTEYPRIRISFVDLDSDMGTELFVSEEAEPSIKDGVFGWQFGSYCVLQTLQAQSGRRGKVELILKVSWLTSERNCWCWITGSVQVSRGRAI